MIDSLLRPIEIEIGGCEACHWPMQEYPPHPTRIRLFELAVDTELKNQNFTEAMWFNEGTTRCIALLGPDSPGEYIYSFDRRLIDVRWMNDTAIDLLWWIRRMGLIRKELMYG